MAASAQLLLSAISSTSDIPGFSKPDLPPQEPDLFDGVSGPDSGLDGSGAFVEPPLTCEPPLADATPLTSESPNTAEPPLTSEPTTAGLGMEYAEV
ncbi:hypothetical protein ACFU99_32150 [Streptomyces sp. NPDC057654]|uniref:hypothetical protein n=1 Tax=Streptomyces sp. NPDC057654 TaxID=3346196 RepID=UPI0036767B4B